MAEKTRMIKKTSVEKEGVPEFVLKRTERPNGPDSSSALSPSYKIGFLGLSAIGQKIIMNLLNSGYDVTIWNRTPEKCDVFVEAGARRGQTPADVIQACDITFSSVSGPEASKALIFGNCGVLKGLEGCTPGEKGYVELTGIDPQTSQDIASEISHKGGRYMEARVHGSCSLAEDGLSLVLAAGDRGIFQDCVSAFKAFSNHAFFLGLEVGTASKMSIFLSMLHGTVTAALAETFSLINSLELDVDCFFEILARGPCSSPLVKEKAQAMIKEKFTTNFAIKHQERDLQDAIQMGDSLNHPLPISKAAHKAYKRAKVMQCSEQDISSVIKAIRK